ncbi:MAG TPA: L-seryl-tRNA(Sec) selenium transferase, partial [Clostridiaceae bacterium]|nr:L-seryl-tRNA(Sec) selenium transferase [Clostridiaceae bacterium]
IKNRAKVKVIEDYSQVGGGAMPTTNIKTYSVAVKPLNKLIDNVEYGLRRSKVPIVARINNDMLIFDVRTLFDRDYKTIADTMDKLL